MEPRQPAHPQMLLRVSGIAFRGKLKAAMKKSPITASAIVVINPRANVGARARAFLGAWGAPASPPEPPD